MKTLTYFYKSNTLKQGLRFDSFAILCPYINYNLCKHTFH